MRAASASRIPRAPLLAFAGIPLLSHLAILATSHTHLGFQLNPIGLFKLGFVTVSALTHWSIYAGLLLGFALTLRPGHEPLISGLARRLHGDGNAALAAYTRKVTIAWSVFFALQLALSVTLFCFAPLTVWSFFVNILDMPLVALMFGAEYAVRLRCLRDPPRHSPVAMFNMVAESLAQARANKAATLSTAPEA
jgi:uncharacterized membrane protein